MKRTLVSKDGDGIIFADIYEDQTGGKLTVDVKVSVDPDLNIQFRGNGNRLKVTFNGEVEPIVVEKILNQIAGYVGNYGKAITTDYENASLDCKGVNTIGEWVTQNAFEADCN